MANTIVDITEVRFVIEPEVTQVYVYHDVKTPDVPLGVQGWHHKTFPASMIVSDIMNAWAAGKENPLMWPLKAPS